MRKRKKGVTRTDASGYAGSILYVNLSTGEIRKETSDLNLEHKFLGGLGMDLKLAYDRIKPETEPLSPENPIIIGAGPLVGTMAPGAARVYSVTKLPANNAVGWGGGGGCDFAAMLKYSGYDHIIVEGKADRPVYLKIFDDDVEICDAGKLWGKTQGEAVDGLKAEYGRPLGVISMGQSGENLVSFAMGFVDKYSTIGRGGLGAVMGSKNLKAFAARGTGGIKVADRKKVKELIDGVYARIRKYPKLEDAQKYGFLNFMPIIPKEDYLKIKKGRVACIGCPVGDKDILKMKKKGSKKFTKKYTGTAVNMFLPGILGGHDLNVSTELTDIMDEYGLDMFETYGVLMFANSLYEHGKLTADELGTEGIDFKNFDAIKEWFRKITYREGFGDFLADGLGPMLEKYGEGTEEYAPCVSKGLLVYQSVRGPVPSKTFSPFEMGMIVLPRGPAAAPGGSSPLYFTYGRPLEWIQGHFDRMGIAKDAQERILKEKHGVNINIGRLTKYAARFLYTCGCMGTCGRGQINRFYSAKLHAALYSAVTGFETSPEELKRAADRVQNLEKVANVREGFSRKDDLPPERWFEEPQHLDYYEKVSLGREIIYEFLDDFYDEMGWDIEKGIPTKKTLLDLDLKEEAEDLESRGLL
ncbi:MAG: hypothetical protein K8R46_14790 [Pirellulales bacterium]|nr:hypothetical protein [Pirellulales bacterium]